MYTVKQISELAGITVRTLHYYDQIGLLKPTHTAANGYRHYDEDALFRLQQILFYREMELDLVQIKKILDDRRFDPITALQSHRERLQQKIERLKTLIQTVDTTIMHFAGEINMSKQSIFQGFDPEKQAQYEKEAEEMWGDTARQSIKLWYSYSEQEKERIMQEGSAIYQDIVANMSKGVDSPEIQAILAHWHRHMRYFYEPSIDMLEGLGNMYHDHPDFNANFTAMHPDLPAFLQKAIQVYVDRLRKQ